MKSSPFLLALVSLFAASTVARADPPRSTAPVIPPAPMGVPFVRFIADHPDIALYREGERRPLCYAPCDTFIEARDGAEFYFEGPSTRASGPISLFQSVGETRFRVEGGNKAKSIAGLVMAISGGSTAFVGGLGLALGGLAGANSSEAVAAEVVGLVGGLVVAVIGGSLRQHNQTKVLQANTGAPLSFKF